MSGRAGISLTDERGRHLPGGTLNSRLYSDEVYTNAVRAEVDAWLAIRNPAAHGDPDFERNYTDAQVMNMIERIRVFVVDYPA